MFVKMIHPSPLQNDPLYKTGVWEHGEIREVPSEIGVKLIGHKDVWERVGGYDPTADSTPAPAEDEEGQIDVAVVADMSWRDMSSYLSRLTDDQLIELLNIEQEKEQPRTTVLNRVSQMIEQRVDSGNG